MLFAIFCTDKKNFLEVRLNNRALHLEHLKAQGDRLIFAGPTFADDGQTMNGSLIVLDCDSRADAETFSAMDPYAQARLFERVEIRAWKKVLPQA
jgi:hypothetical protein